MPPRTPAPRPDARHGWPYRIGSSLAAAAGGLLMWLFWQLLAELGFLVPPPAAVAWYAALTALFLRIYAFPTSGPGRRVRARVRARPPPRAGWGWVALLAVGASALVVSLSVVLLSLEMADASELPQVVRDFMEKPGGELAFLVLVVGVAPIVEEFAFRGWIQHPLERRLGPGAAITIAAALFALAHLEADVFPVRFAAGLVIGHAVYASRSVWTGVAMHAFWNAAVMALSYAAPDLDPSGKGWAWAGPAAAAAVVSLFACAWGVRRLEAAGRARRARAAARAVPAESAGG